MIKCPHTPNFETLVSFLNLLIPQATYGNKLNLRLHVCSVTQVIVWIINAQSDNDTFGNLLAKHLLVDRQCELKCLVHPFKIILQWSLKNW